MNDLKKAIEFGENALAQATQIDEGDSCDFEAESEAFEYHTDSLSFHKQSLLAMQEKLKREQGCDFCANGFRIITYENDNKAIVRSNLTVGVKVNFCPMCGKKLG